MTGAMRAAALDWCRSISRASRNLGLVTGGGVPDSVSLSPGDFLEQANWRSLGVLELKNNRPLCREYRILLSAVSYTHLTLPTKRIV